MSDSDLIRYPFFARIIDNLQNIIDPNQDDLDMSMLFIYLYWYSCKLLKNNGKPLTKENLYNTMEDIFKDHQARTHLLEVFKNKILTIKN